MIRYGKENNFQLATVQMLKFNVNLFLHELAECFGYCVMIVVLYCQLQCVENLKTIFLSSTCSSTLDFENYFNIGLYIKTIKCHIKLYLMIATWTLGKIPCFNATLNCLHLLHCNRAPSTLRMKQHLQHPSGSWHKGINLSIH